MFNFMCEITKIIAMAMFGTSGCQDGNKVLKCMNEGVTALKDALENLNTQKSTSRRILTGTFILSKNSETCDLLIQNLCTKLFSGRSSWSDEQVLEKATIVSEL